ncbi:MAG: hypothetical protein DA394_08160 [Candidatus Arcticimaribacter sp.]|nr:MAG: hypothetical protein DA394_08160 [Candidatus Arcticimaribacter sp.]
MQPKSYFSLPMKHKKLVFQTVKFLILLFIAFSSSDATAQVTNESPPKNSTIYGNITDDLSGESLIGASVIVRSLQIGSSSNEYGYYSLTVSPGDYVLEVSFVGYTTQNINISITENKKVAFELKPLSTVLDEVIGYSKKETKSQVETVLGGISNLKSSEIKQLPSFLGEPDITRVILSQAGVSSIGEGTSGFNVRGGNIDQNLVLLDEAPLFNASHLFGFFSIFNADAIKDLKLYKGGIPARFGGRVSSVLDIRQKEGNSKKFKGEGGVGLLFSRLTLEGPIKKDKINFLISGRRSYFDLFFPLLGDELKNSKVFFYDLNTKLKWKIDDKNTLLASGYFGSDVIKLGFEEPESTTNDASSESVGFQWKNATATLRWNHLFSNKLFMNISGIYSKYEYGLAFKSDSEQISDNNQGTFDWTSKVENWIFKPDFTFYKSAGTKFRFGAHVTLYKFKPANVQSSEENINSINFDSENGIEIAPYFEYEKEWIKWKLNAGLRYSWFGSLGPQNIPTYAENEARTSESIIDVTRHEKGVINKYSGLEPRLALNYSMTSQSALKFGYNRLFQYIHLISNTNAALPFDIWKISGTHIDPIEVNQFSVGYAYDTPKNNFNFTLDTYYKSFRNIVDYKEGADLFLSENIETQLIPVDGFSYGIEATIHKTKGKTTGQLNYTFSTSQRKSKPNAHSSEQINDGTYFPSNFDRPHILNLNLSHQLNTKWSVNANFTFQSGRPNTIPIGKYTLERTQFIQYSDRNAYRLNNSHRLDLSATYTPLGENKKWKGSWSYGVYNAYGRKNAFSVYSRLTNEQLRSYQFSVLGAPIPFITYNFKF